MQFKFLTSTILTAALVCAAAHSWAQSTGEASAPPVAPPNWSADQWDAVMGAVQHTAGTWGYEYHWVSYASEARARVASMVGVNAKGKPFRAISLVAVDPVIRLGLASIVLDGECSKPIRYINENGKPAWYVVQLVSRFRSTNYALDDTYRRFLGRLIQQDFLPKPELLLSDRLERSRVAFVKAFTAEQVAAVDKSLTADVEYGDFNTPLTLAILLNKRDVATALLERGADVNRCGRFGCPLGVAATADNEADALAWTEWLLSQGANPALIDPRFKTSNVTPLTAALEKKYQSLARSLVAAGAPLNGVPDERQIPIEVAARKGQRDMVDWLIASGASVLPFNDRSKGLVAHMNGHLYSGAKASGDTGFATWAEKTMLDAAARSPHYAFDVFVEQAGRRFALTDGSMVTLKPAPFELVMVMKPGQAESVTVGASLSKAWSDEVRRGDGRNPLFRPLSAAAMAEVPSPDAWNLYVGMPCTRKEKVDEPCPGVQMVLLKDANERRDFHSVRVDRHEYVREVRSLYDVSVETPNNKATPLDTMAGKTLYLVLSDALNLGGADGQRLIAPRFVSLSFQN